MSLNNWNASSSDLSRGDPQLVSNHDHSDPVAHIQNSPEAQFLADLLRSIQNNRDVHEIERKRRLDWETNVENNYHARMAAMDIRLTAMQQQVDELKQALDQAHQGQHIPHQSIRHQTPMPNQAAMPPPSLPLSSMAHPPTPVQTMQQPRSQLQASPFGVFNAKPDMPLPRVLGKRQREESELQGDRSDGLIFPPSLDPVSARLTEAELGAIMATKKKKDSRPTTIQTAMRAHVLRVMCIDSDKMLPPSHIENTPVPPNSGIRFVWDKTPKQSAHNGRMKQLLINDLQTSRALYPFVPETEFTWHVLDRTFDQAFTTLRQKYRAQSGLSAPTEEERLELKTKRARRANRKKAKLNHRIAARNTVEEFQDPVFDKALEMSVMSSESSDDGGDEMDDSIGGEGHKSFRTRGYAWRSSKLSKFYATLDIEDQAEKERRPKRGAGRKERRVGPPKEGEEGLPPKGTPLWMLSQRFLQETPPGELARLEVTTGEPFDWNTYDVLGHDSDVEDDLVPSMV